MTVARFLAVLTVLAIAVVGGLAAWNHLRPVEPPPAAPEAAPVVKRAKRKAPSAKGPRLPPEKPCLAAPTDAGEEGMVASAGLSTEDVRATMRGAVQDTLRCFADAPSLTMMLSIRVACSGRVAGVEITDDGGASPEAQGCVREALRYAAFPAHALPDGDTFDYPLTYRAP